MANCAKEYECRFRKGRIASKEVTAEVPNSTTKVLYKILGV